LNHSTLEFQLIYVAVKTENELYTGKGLFFIAFKKNGFPCVKIWCCKLKARNQTHDIKHEEHIIHSWDFNILLNFLYSCTELEFWWKFYDECKPL